MEIGRQDGWTSVNKQMPSDTREVLVSGTSSFGYRIASLAVWMDGFWKILRTDIDPYDVIDIDFWMELPAGPDVTVR